jgi:hypothetical protein
MTKDNYLRNKQELDPLLTESADDTDGSLVIWRESDIMTLKEEHFAKTGVMFPPEKIVTPQSCGHDRLDYNDPNQNPMLRTSVLPSWTDYLLNTLNGSLYKRDDAPTGNGGMGTKLVCFTLMDFN